MEITVDDMLLYVLENAPEDVAAEIEKRKVDPQFAAEVEQVRKIIEMTGSVNLKLILMELGNSLVMEHGFSPTGKKNTTLPIVKFTQWLNDNPIACEVLRGMGVEWVTTEF